MNDKSEKMPKIIETRGWGHETLEHVKIGITRWKITKNWWESRKDIRVANERSLNEHSTGLFQTLKMRTFCELWNIS